MPSALVAGAAFVAALSGSPSAEAANDPKLRYQSIQTAHFRVTYYQGEEAIARKVAAIAEDVHNRLAPVLGWNPTEITEVLLTDMSDAANGSASALPYNQIRLFVTAPDDLSPLGDVDDWFLELVTHEYTHVLHTDQIRGVPALLNRLFGKTFAPNQVQPRWILEGLAVFEESHYTSGGRLRSSQWNMFMRADVLENNVATLDQVSNFARRWPQGNLWYLYGSFFLKWIADTYGELALQKMIYEYSQQIIPYGINRAVRRATGKTFEELYPLWITSLRQQFSAQADQVRARGIREGVALTHVGQTVRKPRFIPATAWPNHTGDLLAYFDTGHTSEGFYALPLKRDAQGIVSGADDKQLEHVIRTRGMSTPSFDPNGRVVFNSAEIVQNLYFFSDLFVHEANTKSPRGLEGHRTRWTDGSRASDPDVSPNGRQIVYVTNHRGTSTLRIADLGGEGIANARALVPSQPYEQAYAPRFSPDGRYVAYSCWKQGGYRDIRVVDTTTGAFVNVTEDRAIDGGPSFSPDGQTLYFHSDRTGIMNVYAFDIAGRRLRQVTNVINGAYEPEVSPDGKTLAYVGYSSRGFDLFAMKLDPNEWLEPEAYVETRPVPPPISPSVTAPATDYNPLYTLRPHAYSLQIKPGNFGQATMLTASGADIAGHHAFSANIFTEWEQPELQGGISYVYGRLPFDMGARVYRSIAPRGGLEIGNYKPTWVEEQVGAETSISYSLPRAFEGQGLSLSYSVSRVAGKLPLPADKLDPYETPAIPRRGMIGALHLGWGYSNTEGTLWGIGPEKGFSVETGFHLADKSLASDFSGYAADLNFRQYYLMPWFRHHTVALHLGAGTGGGNLGGRGLFYVGGFVDQLFTEDRPPNVFLQGGIVMRGYPVVALAGRNYALLNAEYRFPIVNIDRGLSTLPIFLNRISGNLFVDYGSAFDNAATAKFKTGIGGELWFDMMAAYIAGYTFRIGYARGLASSGFDKLYFVAVVPF